MFYKNHKHRRGKILLLFMTIANQLTKGGEDSHTVYKTLAPLFAELLFHPPYWALVKINQLKSSLRKQFIPLEITMHPTFVVG